MNIHPNDPRLIAAAPDLYKAAKAWAYVGYCVWRYPKSDKSCECDWHLCVRAVAAVDAQ